MGKINFKVGPLFRKNLNTPRKELFHVGGTRAGKTFSILLYLWYLSMQVKNLKILITKKTGPSLTITVYQDFIKILTQTQTLGYFDWNKTNKSFTNLATGSFILFSPLDEVGKYKGAGFNYIFMNEGNQFTKEEFELLKLKLSELREDKRQNQIIVDLNPDDYYGWVREYIEQNIEKIDLIESCFKTNPFLSKDYIENVILPLKYQNEHLWKIYGLGKWDKPEHIVYTNWDIVSEDEFENVKPDWEAFGLDFGYNSPSALLHIKVKDKNIYVRELIYQEKLLASELGDLMEEMKISKRIPIYADPAEPAYIEHLKQRGFWIRQGERSVKEGIRELQMCKILISANSLYLISEIKNYSFQKKENKVLEEPVKWKDHALDALRYAYYTHKTKGLKSVLW